jgi:hypothetical protein
LNREVKWRLIENKFKSGTAYPVATRLDLDFIHILLDSEQVNYVQINETNELHHFSGTETKIVWVDLPSEDLHYLDIWLRTIGNADWIIFFQVNQAVRITKTCIGELLDFSSAYRQPFDLLVEADVRRAYRKNIFFSSAHGIWSRVRTTIPFPYGEESMELQFLKAISSSRDILLCYDQVQNLKVIEVRSNKN